MKLIDCKTCGNQGKYSGRNICKACYDSKRKKQRNESYRRSKGLPLDHVFSEKRTHCLTCEKEINYKKKRISNTFCGACYKKDYKKRFPEQVEKSKKYALEKTRKKKGIPLDTPYLISRPGEGHTHHNGYRCLYKPGHHNRKNKLGRVYEHIFVMSEYLGRPLFKGENVHHINGIRDDNRIENLELWNTSQPCGQRVEDKIKFYKEFLEQYGYKITN